METSDILKSRGDTEKPDEVDNIYENKRWLFTGFNFGVFL
jgi:hypothetical protein